MRSIRDISADLFCGVGDDRVETLQWLIDHCEFDQAAARIHESLRYGVVNVPESVMSIGDAAAILRRLPDGIRMKSYRGYWYIEKFAEVS